MTTLVALLALTSLAGQQPAEKVIGSVKWKITDTKTKKVVSEGKSDLTVSKFKLETRNDMSFRTVPLADHFALEMSEYKFQSPLNLGFGITALRDDIDTFNWEWFDADSMTRATKLQEKGEMGIKVVKVKDHYELTRTEFLTDVSFRLKLASEQPGAKPRWRVNILKGSVINWPSIVNGKVVVYD